MNTLSSFCLAAFVSCFAALFSFDAVEGSVFRLMAVNRTGEDGVTRSVCELEWGETLYTIEDEELHLPTTDGKDCFRCGPCGSMGTECAQMFRPCDAGDDYEWLPENFQPDELDDLPESEEAESHSQEDA